MRLVFLTQRLPYAPNRGDRVRAYHELRLLARLGHEVHLVSLVHDEEEASHVDDLRDFTASVHPVPVTRLRNLVRGALRLGTRWPLTHSLLDGSRMHAVLGRTVNTHAPDLVFAYCSSMVRFAMEPPLADIPFVMDMVDVDSAKWAALAEHAQPVLRSVYAREATCLGAFEATAVERSHVTWVVNEREAVLLRTVAGQDARIQALENGVDIDYWRPTASTQASQDVVFCGVMNYAPNEEAALWLARAVWPAVRAQCPGARLLIVGASPTPRLRALPDTDTSVVVTGTVADVRPFLWAGAVAAAPLKIARGVQNKVLEAVAAGLPCVVTPAVAGGLPPEIVPACDVAESPEAYAGALLRMLALSAADRTRRVELAQPDRLSWESRLAPIGPAIEEAVRGRPA